MPTPAPVLLRDPDAVSSQVERLEALGWTLVRADLEGDRVRVSAWTPEGVYAGALVGRVEQVADALAVESRVQGARSRAVAELRAGP